MVIKYIPPKTNKMTTLETFKATLKLEKIQFKKSKKTGREVADLHGISLVKSLKLNSALPMFVVPCTSKEGSPVLVICNQGWDQGTEL